MKIRHRYTGEVIFECDAPTMKQTVEMAVVQNVSLAYANLWQVNLEGADLYQANFYRANLYGAELYRAILLEADLYGADLRYANMLGAVTTGACLETYEITGIKGV